MDTNVVERLEKLERQIKRWKMLSLLLLAIIAVVLTTAAAYPSSEGLMQIPATRLSARSFVLVGRDGNVYGRLGMRAGKPQLELYDEAGGVIWSAPTEALVKPVTPTLIMPESKPKPE